MPEEYLTVAEAAARLKVTRYTMRKWLRMGVVEGLKFDRTWRVQADRLATPMGLVKPEGMHPRVERRLRRARAMD